MKAVFNFLFYYFCIVNSTNRSIEELNRNLNGFEKGKFIGNEENVGSIKENIIDKKSEELPNEENKCSPPAEKCNLNEAFTSNCCLRSDIGCVKGHCRFCITEHTKCYIMPCCPPLECGWNDMGSNLLCFKPNEKPKCISESGSCFPLPLVDKTTRERPDCCKPNFCNAGICQSPCNDQYSSCESDSDCCSKFCHNDLESGVKICLQPEERKKFEFAEIGGECGTIDKFYPPCKEGFVCKDHKCGVCSQRGELCEESSECCSSLCGPDFLGLTYTCKDVGDHNCIGSEAECEVSSILYLDEQSAIANGMIEQIEGTFDSIKENDPNLDDEEDIDPSEILSSTDLGFSIDSIGSLKKAEKIRRKKQSLRNSKKEYLFSRMKRVDVIRDYMQINPNYYSSVKNKETKIKIHSFLQMNEFFNSSKGKTIAKKFENALKFKRKDQFTKSSSVEPSIRDIKSEFNPTSNIQKKKDRMPKRCCEGSCNLESRCQVCKLLGTLCSDSKECCSKACGKNLNGTLTCINPYRTLCISDEDFQCTKEVECCDGYKCKEGKCVKCLTLKSKCTDSGDCCSENCYWDPTGISKTICRPITKKCIRLGKSCSVSDSDSKLNKKFPMKCCGDFATCLEGKCAICHSEGLPCTMNKQCCSGKCGDKKAKDICVGKPANIDCVTPGGTCDDENKCCDELSKCNDNICNRCLMVEEGCKEGKDCCSGNCYWNKNGGKILCREEKEEKCIEDGGNCSDESFPQDDPRNEIPKRCCSDICDEFGKCINKEQSEKRTKLKLKIKLQLGNEEALAEVVPHGKAEISEYFDRLRRVKDFSVWVEDLKRKSDLSSIFDELKIDKSWSFKIKSEIDWLEFLDSIQEKIKVNLPDSKEEVFEFDKKSDSQSKGKESDSSKPSAGDLNMNWDGEFNPDEFQKFFESLENEKDWELWKLKLKSDYKISAKLDGLKFEFDWRKELNKVDTPVKWIYWIRWWITIITNIKEDKQLETIDTETGWYWIIWWIRWRWWRWEFYIYRIRRSVIWMTKLKELDPLEDWKKKLYSVKTYDQWKYWLTELSTKIKEKEKTNFFPNMLGEVDWEAMIAKLTKVKDWKNAMNNILTDENWAKKLDTIKGGFDWKAELNKVSNLFSWSDWLKKLNGQVTEFLKKKEEENEENYAIWKKEAEKIKTKEDFDKLTEKILKKVNGFSWKVDLWKFRIRTPWQRGLSALRWKIEWKMILLKMERQKQASFEYGRKKDEEKLKKFIESRRQKDYPIDKLKMKLPNQQKQKDEVKKSENNDKKENLPKNTNENLSQNQPIPQRNEDSSKNIKEDNFQKDKEINKNEFDKDDEIEGKEGKGKEIAGNKSDENENSIQDKLKYRLQSKSNTATQVTLFSTPFSDENFCIPENSKCKIDNQFYKCCNLGSCEYLLRNKDWICSKEKSNIEISPACISENLQCNPLVKSGFNSCCQNLICLPFHNSWNCINFKEKHK